MAEGDRRSERASASLTAAVDVLDQLPLDSLEPAAAAGLLVELRRSIDRLEATSARLAVVVEESEEWRASGAASMAAWLSRSTGVGLGRAQASLELGDAMADCPALEAAVRSGDVSPAAAAQVIPAVGDDGFDRDGAALIRELAGVTPAVARRKVEEWRAVANPVDDLERRRRAFDERTLTFTPAGDGTTHVSGTVPNETARTLRQVLAHLADEQRLDESGRTRPQRTADALGDLAAAYLRGEVTGGRNLPHLIVMSTLQQFLTEGGVGTDSFTGDVVTSTEIDRLCCDAVIHRYLTDQTGATLNYGRGRRTASPQQWMAMVARDRGCRHPGCDRPPQWCQAHHLREFAARGGHTDLDEMVLLCHHHHHALHDHGWQLVGDPVHLTFTAPDGRTLHSPIPDLPRHDTTAAA